MARAPGRAPVDCLFVAAVAAHERALGVGGVDRDGAAIAVLGQVPVGPGAAGPVVDGAGV